MQSPEPNKLGRMFVKYNINTQILKICLSLFVWKVNILYKEHIVQCTAQAIVKGTISREMHLVTPHYNPTYLNMAEEQSFTFIFDKMKSVCASLHCIFANINEIEHGAPQFAASF